ncbi:tyrosine-type recombinase/integrase [Listeria costaricensis]|uniref:site-specific integrase n=1 Tax=Listeria costaricensis TaxID=2026604 RepID=UPI000C06D952|nr:tyrosine-type recombinase/integrase [Listeria costaricensis]
MASITKRGKKWQYRITYYDFEGKKKQTSKCGFSSRKEAKIAADEVELRLHKYKGIDFSAEKMLFVDYFNEFFETFKKGKRTEANDKHYHLAIKFCKKYFTNLTVQELTREKYQTAINEFGKTHAKTTVQKRHTYIKSCIKHAINEGIIFKDPTYMIEITGAKAAKQETQKYINETDFKRILQYINSLEEKSISHYFILLLATTGLRYSECAGLTWDCVKKDSIIINKTWDSQYTNNFSNTKNYSSNRIITIDRQTRTNLMSLKLLQNNTTKHNLVFCTDGDTPISNNAVNKSLKSACKHLGIQPITCHGLRHTHGSILLYHGLNIKYISRRLGHTDIVTTLQIYSHVLDELEQMESRKVDSIMESLL